MAESATCTVVSSKVIEAFHMMWDHFPQAVLLLKKSREIVAANKWAMERGFVPHKKCYEVVGQSEIHAACKANKALDSGDYERSTTFDKARGRVTDAYWLPIAGEKDMYVHLTVYIKLPQESPPGQ